MSRGHCAASGEEGGDYSECWEGDRGHLGGRMILCGYILVGRKLHERRGSSGLTPWADMRWLNREGGERNNV